MKGYALTPANPNSILNWAGCFNTRSAPDPMRRMAITKSSWRKSWRRYCRMGTSRRGTASTRSSAGFGFDSDQMRRVAERFGPLDWRLPESHALYWATLGLAATRDETDFRCARMAYQCAALSFLRGRLTFNPATGQYEREPEAALLPGALRAFQEAMAEFPDRPVAETYRAFLEQAGAVMLSLGQPDEAARLQQLLSRQ